MFLGSNLFVVFHNLFFIHKVVIECILQINVLGFNEMHG